MAERLTGCDAKGAYYMPCRKNGVEIKKRNRAYTKLAAYEDTGMEPEDIKLLKNSVIIDNSESVLNAIELSEYRFIGTPEEFAKLKSNYNSHEEAHNEN
jgi:hypothetical protein